MHSKHRYLILVVCFVAGVIVSREIFLRLGLFRSDAFHAVFLTNDQVYFGRIVGESRDTLKLKNVYYLKANAEISQASGSAAQAASAKLSLIKLGEELHGPQDLMIINKAHVLFWEEMKGAGVIMDTINEHENKK